MAVSPAFAPTPDWARLQDDNDPLARFRDAFYHAPGQIYLDGNSLGLLCRPAEASLLSVLDTWKTWAIEGWTDEPSPWFFLAETLGAQLAPLVGAEPDEVIVANSTTVNLHQLLATLFQPGGARTKILTDALRFPSDAYALDSHLRLRGLDPREHLVLVESRDGLTLDEDAIIAAMTEDIALAVFPSVVYTSGQLLDMARLTAEAHRRGIVIGFDCAHSIGAVPHALSAWGVDFAFWCHYKYLNAGPGAPGGLYLNRRHFGRVPGLAGWFSSDKARQFDMSAELSPAPNAGALQIGTPPILAMAPLEGALPLFHQAGIERLREKSLALTAYLRDLIDVRLAGRGFTIATPREDARRGGHVALLHDDAVRISRALRADNVVPDFRRPNLIRLAPVALYTRFVDCWEAVRRLETILDEKHHENFPVERGIVP